jgi:NTP pyrophosphatase (non-canonical NTP hydrolase)
MTKPDFNDLQKQMLRSAKFDEPYKRALSLCGLGIGGEASEISDLIKKVFYHGHAFDRDKFIEEGGDLLWYVAYLSHVLEVNFGDLLSVRRPKDDVLYFDDAPLYTRIGLNLTIYSGFVALHIDYLLFQLITSPSFLENHKADLIQNLCNLVSWVKDLANVLNSTLAKMCQVNIEKLNKRYPDGFSTEASLARVDAI